MHTELELWRNTKISNVYLVFKFLEITAESRSGIKISKGRMISKGSNFILKIETKKAHPVKLIELDMSMVEY